MTNVETISKLIEYARAGKHIEFQFITTWRVYKFYKKERKALRLVVKCLRKGCKNLLNNYCKNVKNGSADVINLVVLATLTNTLEFYIEELKILEDMIYEYNAYLLDGNLVYAFLEFPRQESELWDHRES